MVRDSVQLETAVNTISHEYLLDFTSEYGIPEMLHPKLLGPGDKIVDFPEGKVGVYTRNGPIQFDSCSKSYEATDSSGVPSTIERSPLDFAHEAEAFGRGTAAPEMPPLEDVPATAAPGADQAGEAVAAELPAA
nr:hypothetical protein [Tanacetum cinerariifolium]